MEIYQWSRLELVEQKISSYQGDAYSNQWVLVIQQLPKWVWKWYFYRKCDEKPKWNECTNVLTYFFLLNNISIIKTYLFSLNTKYEMLIHLFFPGK